MRQNERSPITSDTSRSEKFRDRKQQTIQGKGRREDFVKKCSDGRGYRKVPRKIQRLEQVKRRDKRREIS